MNTCKICGEPMSLIPAGTSKKTGKPYQAFMACPNKCKSNINNTNPKPNFNFENFVADEFANLNKRLDGLGKFLKENLPNDSPGPELETDEIDVNQIPFR